MHSAIKDIDISGSNFCCNDIGVLVLISCAIHFAVVDDLLRGLYMCIVVSAISTDLCTLHFHIRTCLHPVISSLQVYTVGYFFVFAWVNIF